MYKLALVFFLTLLTNVAYAYSAPMVLYNDHKIGSSKAPVTLIEYSSLSCPACAQVNQHVIQPLINDYVLAGKLLYIHRDFALDKPSLYAAVLANCVDGSEYFNLEKVLFEHQKNWASTNQYLSRLKNIGQLSGLSSSKIDQCFADEALRSRIKAATQQANKDYDVNSVPAIFINGQRVEDISLGKLKQIIDSKINEVVLQNSVLRKDNTKS